MRRLHVGLAALMLAAAAAMLARAANGPGPNPAPNNHILAIGVVEVQDVFHKMSETNKVNTDIANKRKNQLDALEKRKQDLQARVAQRNDFKQGSARWQEETDKIDRESADLDVSARVAQIQLEREQKQAIKMLFDKIEKACQQVAQQNNLDLVLADRKVDFVGPDLDGVPRDRLTDLLGQRSVMYKSNKADITAEVLTLLDAQFAKANGGNK